MLRPPSMQALSARLADAAREIARPLAGAGRRAWIVGGAPRDLALGREPAEIDVASAATPDEVEKLFQKTIPLGRPFGTVLVRVAGLDVQHTTFRSESGYSDARRPDHVAFGTSVEEDSSRRDFTCNALYLDPLDDRVVDPQAGLVDLAARRLRCVGDPAERFREDGLRLLRLARFAAGLDLEPTPETLEAARRSADALRGVSPERVLVELQAMMTRPGTARALAILEDLGLLERALPGLPGLVPGGVDRTAWWGRRKAAFEAFSSPPGLALGLAALLGPDPGEPGPSDENARSLAVAEALRLPRAERTRIRAIWGSARSIAGGSAPSRATRIRLMRSPGFDEAVRLLRAQGAVEVADAWAREEEALGEAGLRPAPLLAAADLEAAAIPRGPRWSELLSQVETLQLDGALSSRSEARAWLAAQAQDGGKTPRSR